MTKTRLAILSALSALLLVATPWPAAAETSYSVITATNLGFTAAKAISSGFTTESVDMQSDRGKPRYSLFSMPFTIVWGTSTSVEVQLQGSIDDDAWNTVTRCTSAEIHICKPRRWQFGSADGTTPILDFRQTLYRYLRVVVVAGSGNGTILGTAAVRGN